METQGVIGGDDGFNDGLTRALHLRAQARARFQLDGDTIVRFQKPGAGDAVTDPARKAALRDVWAVFEQYKVKTLQAYMKHDHRAGATSDDREGSFAYFDAVQDVMRAAIYGAPFESLAASSVFAAGAGSPYAACRALIDRMTPPATARGTQIQRDLVRILDAFVATGGDAAAAEKRIDPNLAAANDAVAAARAAHLAATKTPPSPR